MRNAAVSTVAPRFAAALDAEDYETVATLLSPDCEYVARRGALVSPDAIVASYREAGKWAKANIASVTYESSVRAVNESSAVIVFVDHLEDSGLRHSYRCEQSIEIRADGRIARIVHIEMPGEREAADAFLRRIGVSRDTAPTRERDG
jgi:hypothetical protein